MTICESQIDSQEHSTINHRSDTSDNAKIGAQLSRLPYELLSEIFLWCCPNVSSRTFCHPHSALTLSHVCRKWRQVVLRTPQLWTYTNLRAKRHDVESATNLILLWSERAGLCPLVIDLDLSEYAQYRTPDNVLPTVLEIIELAEDAKSSLQVSSKTAPRLSVSIEPSTEIAFPYVAENFYWMNSDNLNVNGNPGHGSIHLRISMQPCIILGLEGHSDFGPYLVHLDLRDTEENISVSISELRDILRTYPNLEYIAARASLMGDELMTRESITLSSLKTLCLTWEDEVDPGLLFENIRAPVLEELELDGVISGHWHHLLSFLQHNSAPLRKLDLYKLDCSSIDLLSCLSQCPLLERLWIEDSTISEEMICEFTEFRESRESAIQVLRGLRLLGIVKTDVFDASRLFREFVQTGYIWELTKLDGLYISNCGVQNDINGTKAWPTHLLRSRFLEGAYSKLN